MLGTALHRIPQAGLVHTGWAIPMTDLTTRELLLTEDLEATAVETGQKWFLDKRTLQWSYSIMI